MLSFRIKLLVLVVLAFQCDGQENSGDGGFVVIETTPDTAIESTPSAALTTSQATATAIPATSLILSTLPVPSTPPSTSPSTPPVPSTPLSTPGVPSTPPPDTTTELPITTALPTIEFTTVVADTMPPIESQNATAMPEMTTMLGTTPAGVTSTSNGTIQQTPSEGMVTESIDVTTNEIDGQSGRELTLMPQITTTVVNLQTQQPPVAPKTTLSPIPPAACTCQFECSHPRRACPDCPVLTFEEQRNRESCLACVERCYAVEQIAICENRCRVHQCPKHQPTIETIRHRTQPRCRDCITKRCNEYVQGENALLAKCMFAARRECKICEFSEFEITTRQRCDSCVYMCITELGTPVFPLPIMPTAGPDSMMSPGGVHGKEEVNLPSGVGGTGPVVHTGDVEKPVKLPGGVGGPIKPPVDVEGPVKSPDGYGGPVKPPVDIAGPVKSPDGYGGPVKPPVDIAGPVKSPDGYGGPVKPPVNIGGPVKPPSGFEGPVKPPGDAGGPVNSPSGFEGPVKPPGDAGGPVNSPGGYGGPVEQPKGIIRLLKPYLRPGSNIHRGQGSKPYYFGSSIFHKIVAYCAANRQYLKIQRSPLCRYVYQKLASNNSYWRTATNLGYPYYPPQGYLYRRYPTRYYPTNYQSPYVQRFQGAW